MKYPCMLARFFDSLRSLRMTKEPCHSEELCDEESWFEILRLASLAQNDKKKKNKRAQNDKKRKISALRMTKREK